MELTFTNLLIIVAWRSPRRSALGFVPRVRVPSVVIEIVLGIVVGPAVLGWVHVDDPVQVFATVGLAYLLFLAGLEIDFERLRGRVLRLAAAGLRRVARASRSSSGSALKAGGLATQPLFVAIVLSATSLGVLVPVLKDADEIGSTFGQLVIAAGTIADFATRDPALALLLARVGLHRVEGHPARRAVRGRGARRAADRRRRALPAHWARSCAACRTRPRRSASAPPSSCSSGSWRWPTELGLEVILGAFIAGAIISLVDRDRAMTHPDFRRKLEAPASGSSSRSSSSPRGVKYDLDALTAHTSTLLHVPVFLAALLIVRGLPALLYRPVIPRERVPVAVLMQATSLPFIVAATAVGLALDVVTPANAAALIARRPALGGHLPRAVAGAAQARPEMLAGDRRGDGRAQGRSAPARQRTRPQRPTSPRRRRGRRRRASRAPARRCGRGRSRPPRCPASGSTSSARETRGRPGSGARPRWSGRTSSAG